MKTRLLFLFMMAGVALLAACGDDDGPEVNPLVGEWELDEIIVTDPPSSYSMVEGQEFQSIYGEDEYIITFNSDLTYTRELENTPDGDLDDEGTWEQDGDEIILDPEDGDDIIPLEMDLLEDIDDDLKVSFRDRIFALSDEILNDPVFQDTVTTQQQYNAVFVEYAQQIDVTLELEFERQD